MNTKSRLSFSLAINNCVTNEPFLVSYWINIRIATNPDYTLALSLVKEKNKEREREKQRTSLASSWFEVGQVAICRLRRHAWIDAITLATFPLERTRRISGWSLKSGKFASQLAEADVCVMPVWCNPAHQTAPGTQPVRFSPSLFLPHLFLMFCSRARESRAFLGGHEAIRMTRARRIWPTSRCVYESRSDSRFE